MVRDTYGILEFLIRHSACDVLGTRNGYENKPVE